MKRTKLFDLSHCFHANRDNFCPNEQALNQANYETLLRKRYGFYLVTCVLYLLRINE